jgi:retron-type reverse transcriptase
LERELVRLHEELVRKTYNPSEYRSFRIFEPKEREIAAAAYRDRVVHHALTSRLADVFEPTFIANSFANRKGKGTHAAVDKCQQYAKRFKYVWKCDIRQFFPSIDHGHLIRIIERKIKDPDVVWLCLNIITNSPATHYRHVIFPGDDLLTASERPCGLPIGNQTSQFFANVYMNPLDHGMHDTFGAARYIRYVDDFLVFANSTKELALIRQKVKAFCEGLRLELHSSKNIFQRCEDGIRFLGFRVFPTHKLLCDENVSRFMRRMRKLSEGYSRGQVEWEEIRNRLGAWHGHAIQADTGRLRSILYGKLKFRKGSPLKQRLLRGGSFNNQALNVRSSNRNNNEPTIDNNNYGFRPSSS